MVTQEATEILLKQLEQLKAEEKEQLKAEEKEVKRRRKEEKRKAKAMKMERRTGMESESSSSSSESSDSDCGGEVVNMRRLRNEAEAVAQPQPVVQQAAVAVLPGPAKLGGLQDCLNPGKLEEGHWAETNSLREEKRVEVCMGGKCKKSGGAALLEEFQRVMGGEGAVVACKCMGKCRDGPNVRVLNQVDGLSDSLRTPPNPLCIGVGLQDVEAIVSNFFGEEYEENLGCAPS